MTEYIQRNIDKELLAWKEDVKSSTQGGMKSLWLFMREKKLTEAFRCSLENFGEFDYIDKEGNDAIRHVTILPLYALSLLRK